MIETLSPGQTRRPIHLGGTFRANPRGTTSACGCGEGARPQERGLWPALRPAAVGCQRFAERPAGCSVPAPERVRCVGACTDKGPDGTARVVAAPADRELGWGEI